MINVGDPHLAVVERGIATAACPSSVGEAGTRPSSPGGVLPGSVRRIILTMRDWLPSRLSGPHAGESRATGVAQFGVGVGEAGSRIHQCQPADQVRVLDGGRTSDRVVAPAEDGRSIASRGVHDGCEVFGPLFPESVSPNPSPDPRARSHAGRRRPSGRAQRVPRAAGGAIGSSSSESIGKLAPLTITISWSPTPSPTYSRNAMWWSPALA